MNVMRWDMRFPDPVRVPGAVGWPGTPRGARATPGDYRARLHVGDRVIEQPFTILGDPGVDTTTAEYQQQFALLREVHGAISDAHGAVNTIRSVRRQIDDTLARARKAELDEPLRSSADELKSALAAIEEQIIQTRSKSPQDPLNFPVRINDKLAALSSAIDGDYPPTAQTREVFEHLHGLLQEQLEALETLLKDEVPAFNQLVDGLRIPAIIVEEED
ncbi:MAG: hypothetical protein ACYTGC_00155 [Planctomycetota bacterium]|jgi:hypothetical protein